MIRDEVVMDERDGEDVGRRKGIERVGKERIRREEEEVRQQGTMEM